MDIYQIARRRYASDPHPVWAMAPSSAQSCHQANALAQPLLHAQARSAANTALAVCSAPSPGASASTSPTHSPKHPHARLSGSGLALASAALSESYSELEPDDVSGSGATVFETAISLVKVCVGTGVLALPWAMLNGGVVSAPGMVLIGVWNFYTSHQLLVCRGEVTPLERSMARSTFSAFAYAALGTPGVALFESSLLLVLLGVCISLQIQSAQLVCSFTPQVVGHPFVVLALSVCVVPMVLQRTLRGVALISVAALSVLAASLAAVAAYGIHAAHALPQPPPQLAEMPSTDGLAAFFGIAAFSFGMQGVVLPFSEAMAEPRRAHTALSLATVGVVLFYLVSGLLLACLYWQADGGVQQLILLNIPPGSFASTFVCACSAAVSLLSYPILYAPIIQLLQPMMWTLARPELPSTALLADQTREGRNSAGAQDGAQNGVHSSTQISMHSSTQKGAHSDTQNGIYSNTQNGTHTSAPNGTHNSTPNSGHSSIQNGEQTGTKSSPQAADSSKRADIKREQRLRLLLLALTTTVSALTTKFGVVASIIGCLTILQGQLLPPLIHLQLVSRRARARRSLHCARDVVLAAAGLAACVLPATNLVGQLIAANASTQGDD